MTAENEQDLTSVRFIGDITITGHFKPEAIEKLKVGATVTSRMPNDSGVEFRVTEITREGGEIVARVKGGRAERI